MDWKLKICDPYNIFVGIEKIGKIFKIKIFRQNVTTDLNKLLKLPETQFCQL